MKQLAAEGRTILVSSHLMNEMAVTADHLIVIGRGRLLADAATQEVIARGSGTLGARSDPGPGPAAPRWSRREGGTAVLAVNGNGGTSRRPPPSPARKPPSSL